MPALVSVRMFVADGARGMEFAPQIAFHRLTRIPGGANNHLNVTLIEDFDRAPAHATDKIQRDIEDILLKYDMYYERRINYYVNQGMPNEKIFSPLYLAAGYIALVDKLPHKAVTLKNRFMRNPRQYENVFSQQDDLSIWPRIASILRTSDIQLEKMRITKNMNTENFLKSIRYVVGLITVARLLGKLNYSIHEFTKLRIQDYTQDEVKRTWEDMQKLLPPIWNKAYWRKKVFVTELVARLAVLYSLPGADTVVKRRDTMYNDDHDHQQYEITDAFLDEVHKRLPAQPWPVGIHKIVARDLNVPNGQVSQAINVLVLRRTVRKQINGIVWSSIIKFAIS